MNAKIAKIGKSKPFLATNTRELTRIRKKALGNQQPARSFWAQGIHKLGVVSAKAALRQFSNTLTCDVFFNYGNFGIHGNYGNFTG